MIIWTSMRTGGTVLVNHLLEPYVLSRGVSQFALRDVGLKKGEYGKLWSPDFLRKDYYSLDYIDAVVNYNLVVKVYPREMDASFYHYFLKRTKHMQHVILFRESTYDRLISQYFRSYIAGNEKSKSIYWLTDDMIKKYPINVDDCLRWERDARRHYTLAIDHMNKTDIQYKTISYEDIYYRKDSKKVLDVFPKIDKNIFTAERYGYKEAYDRLLNADKLKEAVKKLPSFDLLPIA